MCIVLYLLFELGILCVSCGVYRDVCRVLVVHGVWHVLCVLFCRLFRVWCAMSHVQCSVCCVVCVRCCVVCIMCRVLYDMCFAPCCVLYFVVFCCVLSSVVC